MFDRIRRECPKQLDKMRMVAGDVGLDKLGICADDLERMQVRVEPSEPRRQREVYCANASGNMLTFSFVSAVAPRSARCPWSCTAPPPSSWRAP